MKSSGKIQSDRSEIGEPELADMLFAWDAVMIQPLYSVISTYCAMPDPDRCIDHLGGQCRHRPRCLTVYPVHAQRLEVASPGATGKSGV